MRLCVVRKGLLTVAEPAVVVDSDWMLTLSSQLSTVKGLALANGAMAQMIAHDRKE